MPDRLQFASCSSSRPRPGDRLRCAAQGGPGQHVPRGRDAGESGRCMQGSARGGAGARTLRGAGAGSARRRTPRGGARSSSTSSSVITAGSSAASSRPASLDWLVSVLRREGACGRRGCSPSASGTTPWRAAASPPTAQRRAQGAGERTRAQKTAASDRAWGARQRVARARLSILDSLKAMDVDQVRRALA